MRKFLVPVLILSAVFMFWSCGRKAPPVPPHLVIPRITDLKAAQAATVVELTWTAADPKADVARTRVMKSELKDPGGCPGCPRDFEIIADLYPGDIKTENGLAKFVDYNVKNGFLYSYKLALCDSSGLCGEESNTAEARTGP
jgi:hypothetical protein